MGTVSLTSPLEHSPVLSRAVWGQPSAPRIKVTPDIIPSLILLVVFQSWATLSHLLHRWLLMISENKMVLSNRTSSTTVTLCKYFIKSLLPLLARVLTSLLMALAVVISSKDMMKEKHSALQPSLKAPSANLRSAFIQSWPRSFPGLFLQLMQLHFWVPFYLTFALYFVFLLFPLCLQCSPMLCFSDSWYNFCFLYDPSLLRVNKRAHDLATVVSYYPSYCSSTLGWIVPVPLIEVLKNCQHSWTFFTGACFPKDLTYQFWVHWTLPYWRSFVFFSLSFWEVGFFFPYSALFILP